MSGAVTIMCAKCRKPVERWEAWDNPSRDARTFKAWCHGELDQCEANYSFLMRIMPGQAVEAVAFQNYGRLATPTQRDPLPLPGGER